MRTATHESAGPRPLRVRLPARRPVRSLLAERAVKDRDEAAAVVEARSGVIWAWNPAAERLLGHTAWDAIGRPLSAFFEAGVQRELEAELAARGAARPAWTMGACVPVEYPAVHQTGETVTIGLALTRLEVAGSDGTLLLATMRALACIPPPQPAA